MRIVTIASQKGGAGKTTLAAYLAVEAEHTGAGPVAVVDTGPQGSLAAWWNSREAPTPLLVSAATPQRLHQCTPHLEGHCRSVVHNSGSMSI
jgi:cellulose biosynthesis protein BcsQ